MATCDLRAGARVARAFRSVGAVALVRRHLLARVSSRCRASGRTRQSAVVDVDIVAVIPHVPFEIRACDGRISCDPDSSSL